jgi:branched-chain amino acid transport system permease protein
MWRAFNREKMLLTGVTVALALAFATWVKSPVIIDAAVYFFYFLMLSASWNLLAGFSGQMSFGHVALALAGAYGAASFANVLRVPMAAAILLGAVATAIIGLCIGAITLRFRNITFALATFAFAGVFTSWLTGATDITGGDNGMSATPLSDGDQGRLFVWLGLALCVAFYLLQWLILASRWGILMRAIRDREDVARGLGANATLIKVAVFTYTAFWAGLAGGFFAAYVGYVTPSLGALANMGLVLGMAVVGGMGTVIGPILGTLAFRCVDYFTSGYGGEYTVFAFAVILLFMMLFMRDGIAGLIASLVRRMRAPRTRWQTPSPRTAGCKPSANR